MEKSIKPYLRIHFVCLRFFRTVPRKGLRFLEKYEFSEAFVRSVVASNFPALDLSFPYTAHGRAYANDI